MPVLSIQYPGKLLGMVTREVTEEQADRILKVLDGKADATLMAIVGHYAEGFGDIEVAAEDVATLLTLVPSKMREGGWTPGDVPDLLPPPHRQPLDPEMGGWEPRS